MPRRLLASLTGATLLASGLGLAPPASIAAETTPPVDEAGRSALGLGLQQVLDEGTRVDSRPGTGPRADSSASQVRQVPERLAARDARGRVRVTVAPAAGADQAAYRAEVERAGLRVSGADAGTGSLEGYASEDAVREIAALPGTGTLNLSTAPLAMQGEATSQGVRQHRVDRVHRRGVDGRGVTIGALSDSYDQATSTVTGDDLTVRAADDVASGDLPAGVVVVEDYPDPASVTDEGRAMLQVAHDVAPGARLCFATANAGLLGFATNVRRLADPQGSCRADVLVDDIVYFEEPAFSDSVLTDAIDDVARAGVHYFSAVGNQGEQAAWDGRIRLMDDSAATSVDLSQAPADLFDGGLVDLDQGRGTDVAQDVDLGPGGSWFNLQWDDPLDPDGAVLGDPWLAVEQTSAEPEASFPLDVTEDRVGRPVLLRVDSVPSESTDLVLVVEGPDGEELARVDQGTSPEVLATTFDTVGEHTVRVLQYDEEPLGRFELRASPVVEPSDVGTDLNLLFFDDAGDFLFAVADDNELTGRPQELTYVEGPGAVQVVVARSGTGPMSATRLRHVLYGDSAMTEHVDPLAPAVMGHAYARGATAVAAHDAFRPFGASFLTSPGGDLPVLFDSAGERLRRPETRRVPQVAGVEGGNTTFFGIDNPRDADDQPNFFGTSAAAPHVAGVAALVLDRRGDRLTPTQLRRHLERTAYLHDLDPLESSGRSGALTLTASGAPGYELRPNVPGAMVDDEFFTLSWSGGVPLRSVTLYGESASPTALTPGVLFDPRPLPEAAPWRDGGFPFTVGGTSGGLRADDVSASFGGRTGDGQFRRMTIRFERGLRGGQEVRFGVDRDLRESGFGGGDEGNGADELGGAVLVPQGLPLPVGLAFEATRADGRKVYGMVRNDLGRGWTPVDGHGLVDAEAATFG